MNPASASICFFFFNDTATTEIYTLSLHDALPISLVPFIAAAGELKTKPTQHSVKEMLSIGIQPDILLCRSDHQDRKSTRLNSSHSQISYAVFCLKKKTSSA